MKSLLLSLLIIGLLLVLYLRPWSRGDGVARDPTDRFMEQCTTVFSEQPRPEDYCRCLWRQGVRSPGGTLTKASGRAAAKVCGGQGAL